MSGYIPQKFFFILFIKRVVKRAGPNVSIFQTNFSSFLSIELQSTIASVYVYLRWKRKCRAAREAKKNRDGISNRAT